MFGCCWDLNTGQAGGMFSRWSDVRRLTCSVAGRRQAGGGGGDQAEPAADHHPVHHQAALVYGSQHQLLAAAVHRQTAYCRRRVPAVPLQTLLQWQKQC